MFPLLCILATISSSSEVSAIYGGAAVARNDPLGRQIVLLRVKRPDHRQLLCAGLYYSPKLIVTAAHCLLIMPESARKLTGAEQQAAHRDAPQARIADVKVFYRHVGAWLQPKDFRLDREGDVAVIMMSKPHPAGYQVGLFDERSSIEIVQQLRDATFVHLGHEKLGHGSVGEVRRVDRKPSRLAQGPVGRILMKSEDNAGVCFGDSGAPVYIQEGSGSMKVIGMHQYGVVSIAQSAVPGTDV